MRSPRRFFVPTSGGPRKRNGAFILTELLAIVAVIAILIGLLVPAVRSIRETTIRNEMQTQLQTTLCEAVLAYANTYGQGYPRSIDDSKLQAFFPEADINPATGLIYGATTDTSDYFLGEFKLTLTSTNDAFNDLDSNFDLCARETPSPEDEDTRDTVITYCVDDTCTVTTSYPGTPPPTLLPVVPAPALSLAAQITVRFFDLQPPLIPQVRAYLHSPETSSMVFAMLDTNQDGAISLAELDANPITAPFSTYFHSPPGPFADLIDSQVMITPADLNGDPGFLFSYSALRTLDEYYSTKPGVATALSAKLTAAEAAESRGNADAMAGQLNAYRSQLSAQSGKAFSPDEVHVLTVLSNTLIPGNPI